MKKILYQSGVTLLELMVTIAVIGILSVIMVPSMVDFIANNRMVGATNTFVGAIGYARSEAVRRSANITMVARAPGDPANEWGGGWDILDANGNLIRAFDPISASATLDATTNETTLTFDSRGLRVGLRANAIFVLCDNRTAETGRQITLAPLGRPQLDRQFLCP